MSTATVDRRPASGTLAEVIDIILDKGLVIDAFVRVSLVGIELLTVDIRVVVASVDTYLHFAEATNRLDLREKAEEHDADLQDLVGGMAAEKTEGAIEGAKEEFGEPIESGKEKVKAVFGQDEDAEETEEQED
ncbi:gas vesicle protein [Egibacter rhizosphaerae]|uniref:Gas vesicle protein A n=1 Tax=Egibacter rhizosphaerae TaxID=1670831 RepID=A0A411YBX8_9ACTN|nr:gas vesicle protein GvpJ [Egibacter rhizosphaerae]QBI18685.1 gas vesicle protein [Egibacter rhizosphaerae]